MIEKKKTWKRIVGYCFALLWKLGLICFFLNACGLLFFRTYAELEFHAYHIAFAFSAVLIIAFICNVRSIVKGQSLLTNRAPLEKAHIGLFYVLVLLYILWFAYIIITIDFGASVDKFAAYLTYFSFICVVIYVLRVIPKSNLAFINKIKYYVFLPSLFICLIMHVCAYTYSIEMFNFTKSYLNAYYGLGLYNSIDKLNMYYYYHFPVLLFYSFGFGVSIIPTLYFGKQCYFDFKKDKES